jgi:hypothetical protein
MVLPPVVIRRLGSVAAVGGVPQILAQRADQVLANTYAPGPSLKAVESGAFGNPLVAFSVNSLSAQAQDWFTSNTTPEARAQTIGQTATSAAALVSGPDVGGPSCPPYSKCDQARTRGRDRGGGCRVGPLLSRRGAVLGLPPGERLDGPQSAGLQTIRVRA